MPIVIPKESQNSIPNNQYILTNYTVIVRHSRDDHCNGRDGHCNGRDGHCNGRDGQYILGMVNTFSGWSIHSRDGQYILGMVNTTVSINSLSLYLLSSP